MADEASLKVPRDVLEPIIQANIASAVLAAIGDNTNLVEMAVAQVLNEKVDESGKRSNYDFDRDRTRIQWMMHQAVITATKEALTDAMSKYQDKLKAMIAAEFSKSKSPLVKQLVSGMVGAMTNPDALKYRLTVTYDEKSRY
jgi:hypothetical protein